MTVVQDYDADDRIVVGYFSGCGNASRAIDELLDEGFEIATIGAVFRTPHEEAGGSVMEGERRAWMRQLFGDTANAGGGKRSHVIRMGAGESPAGFDFEYSEPSFENSFMGMGLTLRDARNLSQGLTRGGAVVSITPGSRASLAEGILERNHGRVRFNSLAEPGAWCDSNEVEIYGRMHNYYRPEESLRRKAS
jgi:hypothetical protein